MLWSQHSSNDNATAQTDFNAVIVITYIQALFYIHTKKVNYFIWNLTIGDPNFCRSIPTSPQKKPDEIQIWLSPMNFFKVFAIQHSEITTMCFSDVCSYLPICITAAETHVLDLGSYLLPISTLLSSSKHSASTKWYYPVWLCLSVQLKRYDLSINDLTAGQHSQMFYIRYQSCATFLSFTRVLFLLRNTWERLNLSFVQCLISLCKMTKTIRFTQDSFKC